ncbi:MAG: SCP2 sterol-binding domain-containing protein [Nitrososphaerota archaeon]|jgi:putative sterol carrier protein|nr:SCP2 sterol-binding domain-containing protein [Nitrososphaerota archaeon]
MEIKTSQEFFETKLPVRFKPEKAKDIEATIQVNLTGNNPNDWVIIVKNQKIQTFQGITEEPILILKVSEEDFLEIVNGKISIEKAFFSGKVDVKGDIAIALKLKDTGFL